MLSAGEFYEAINRRPVLISVILQVSDEDLKVSNRMAAEAHLKYGVGSVNEVFDRLFGPDSKDGMVFRADSYEGVTVRDFRKLPSAGESKTIETKSPAVSDSTRQIVPSTSVVRPISSAPARSLGTPSRIVVKVHRASGVPQSAGALGTDPLFKPFNSDPFVEVFVAKGDSPEKLTVLQLREKLKPYSLRMKAETIVVRSDATGRSEWNAEFAFPLPKDVYSCRKFNGDSEYFLVIFLRDYRILTEAADMGGVALPIARFSSSTENHRLGLQGGNYFEVSETKIDLEISMTYEASNGAAAESQMLEEQEVKLQPEEVQAEGRSQSTPFEESPQNRVPDRIGNLTSQREEIPWMFRPWARAVAHANAGRIAEL